MKVWHPCGVSTEVKHIQNSEKRNYSQSKKKKKSAKIKTLPKIGTYIKKTKTSSRTLICQCLHFLHSGGSSRRSGKGEQPLRSRAQGEHSLLLWESHTSLLTNHGWQQSPGPTNTFLPFSFHLFSKVDWKWSCIRLTSFGTNDKKDSPLCRVAWRCVTQWEISKPASGTNLLAFDRD